MVERVTVRVRRIGRVGVLAASPALALAAFLAAPCAHALPIILRTYPGAAPCAGTLQACIDGAGSGDVIQIASSTLIEEDLTIAKSITLTAADGFTPELGGELTPRALHPRQINVQQASNGAATHVVFSKLTLDADVNVAFSAGSGHSFTFDHSKIERYYASADLATALANFPGTTPLDFCENALLTVVASVPASVLVQDSTFIASGGNLALQAQGAAADAIRFDVLRNRFIGAECCGGEFQSTILLDLESGAVESHVTDNLTHRRTSGSTSFSVGVVDFSAEGKATGNAYLDNNTFDDGAEPGNTLDGAGTGAPDVRAEGTSYGLYVSISQPGMLHLSNNVFSSLQGDFLNDPMGLVELKNNDFFAINNSYWDKQASAAQQLSVDPGFVSYTKDFHLKSDSLLVNAGFDSPAGGLSDTDLDENARLVGAHVDIGAYEFAPSGGAGGAGGGSGDAGMSGVGGGSAGGSGSGAGGGSGTGGGSGGAGVSGSGSGAAGVSGSGGGSGDAGRSGSGGSGGISGDAGRSGSGGVSAGAAGKSGSGGSGGSHAGSAGSSAGSAGSSAGTGASSGSSGSDDGGGCSLTTGRTAPGGFAWSLALLAALGLRARARRNARKDR